MGAARALIVAIVIIFTLGLASSALAQYPPNSDVLGNKIQKSVTTQNAPAQRAPTQPGSLAITGADITLYLLLGVGLIGTGAIVIRGSRTRRAAG